MLTAEEVLRKRKKNPKTVSFTESEIFSPLDIMTTRFLSALVVLPTLTHPDFIWTSLTIDHSLMINPSATKNPNDKLISHCKINI